MQCPNCGHELPPEQTFCTSCGQRVTGDARGVPQPRTGVPAPPPSETSAPSAAAPPAAPVVFTPPARGLNSLPPHRRLLVMMILCIIGTVVLVLIFNAVRARIDGVRPFSGKYTDTAHNFSMQIPGSGWRAVELKNPGQGSEYARFFRGSANALTLRVYVMPSSAYIPPEIPQEFVEGNKPVFKKDIQKIFLDEGTAFNLKSIKKLGGLGGRDGVELQGTAVREEGKTITKQVDAFVAFQDDFRIILLFIAGTDNLAKAKSDIRAISESFQFE